VLAKLKGQFLGLLRSFDGDLQRQGHIDCVDGLLN
jgi:hypothetical protein